MSENKPSDTDFVGVYVDLKTKSCEMYRLQVETFIFIETMECLSYQSTFKYCVKIEMLSTSN